MNKSLMKKHDSLMKGKKEERKNRVTKLESKGN